MEKWLRQSKTKSCRHSLQRTEGGICCSIKVITLNQPNHCGIIFFSLKSEIEFNIFRSFPSTTFSTFFLSDRFLFASQSPSPSSSFIVICCWTTTYPRPHSYFRFIRILRQNSIHSPDRSLVTYPLHLVCTIPFCSSLLRSY